MAIQSRRNHPKPEKGGSLQLRRGTRSCRISIARARRASASRGIRKTGDTRAVRRRKQVWPRVEVLVMAAREHERRPSQPDLDKTKGVCETLEILQYSFRLICAAALTWRWYGLWRLKKQENESDNFLLGNFSFSVSSTRNLRPTSNNEGI
jgi:hypothetical protein